MSEAAQGQRRPGRAVAGLPVGALLAVTIGVTLVLAVVGIGLALLANGRLGRERRLLLNEVQPALRAALRLEAGLIDEETGVRGYVLTAEPRFLEPYRSGAAAEIRAYTELRAREGAIGAAVTADVKAVRARAEDWRQRYVLPAVTRVFHGVPRSVAAEVEGKHLFDAIRAALSRLQAGLARENRHAGARLDQAAHQLGVLLVLAAVLVLGGIVGAGALLNRTITRPLARLGRDARRVAGGEFATPLAVPAGPREVAELGSEIDAMRERIVAELARVEGAEKQLRLQAAELGRSNAELEQFAYVASHDLQEPLRKVTSFCQALQKRYAGQLDDRADQYIEFAVDGAKRMQRLITDLLAFSRVRPSGAEHELVDLAGAVAVARAALAVPLEQSGGELDLGPLPSVLGDRTLLASLFQNLISNALKFHGERPPRVRITAIREGGEWLITCSDNGIGIEPEYAERIFLIFQRLHTREDYDGSGIGLALCRKIVEYHGGRIWLDTDYRDGASFRMTLPVAEDPR